MQQNVFHGWLLVNKPAGVTSAGVVRAIKKKFNPEKIGHAGTLDPDATGLIPLAIGEATKAIPYLLKLKKKYQAIFHYGLKTDTDDISGKILKTSSYVPKKNEVLDALEYYSEVMFQIPPKVSAVKVRGTRAYKRFKANEVFRLEARNIKIHEISLISHNEKGASFVQIECGKGGYVRSIARDIGDFLGCFGCVKTLKRVEYGPFKIEEAIDLSELLDHSRVNIGRKIKAIEMGVPNLKILKISLDDFKYLENGRPIACPVTLSLAEGEELFVKYKARLAGVVFKEGSILKVKRKYNT